MVEERGERQLFSKGKRNRHGEVFLTLKPKFRKGKKKKKGERKMHGETAWKIVLGEEGGVMGGRGGV